MKTRLSCWISLVAVVALLVSAPALAQRVSVDLSGQVTDASGAPLEGATVEIVHEPSGTTRFTDTQTGGRYQAQGLRPGGPYRVTAYNDGFEPQAKDGITLALGRDESVNFSLEAGSANLDALEVVGVAQSATFQPDNMGAATTVTREQIENFASIDRSIQDYARFDPRVNIVDDERGELSVAGANNRFNNVLIDGVPANDSFGLNANGQPATNQAISIEWIDQLAVEVAPYDVTQTGSTGGFINSITKSGTNEFSGSVYGTYRDDSFVGDAENGSEFPEFEEKYYGANVGGPIIPDTLFFFVGYEKYENIDPSAGLVGLRGSGTPDIFDLDPAVVNDLISRAQSQYGIDIGSIQGPSEFVLEQDNYIAKLDWNINDQHRASFRYNKSEGTEPNVVRNRFAFALSSHFYDEQRDYDAYTGQLFSDWTSNFSTELRATTTEYQTSFDLGSVLPEVTIETDAGDLLFGTELFRQANALNVQTDNIFLNANYFAGLHSFDFGVEYYEQAYDNLFVFGQNGQYVFESIDDFFTGNPDFYQFRTSSDPNNPDLPRTVWAYDRTGVWAQDTWQVTGDLTLQFGARYDEFGTDDRPLRNQLFEQAYGFSNQGTVDGEGVFQPRIGFNWQMGEEFDAQLRGGIGVFVGRQPGVWLSNPFTNPGGTIDVFNCFSTSQCGDAGVTFNPDVNNQPRVGGNAGARQDVDVVEDGFNLPTDILANLAYEMELPWFEDTILGLEVIRAEVQEGIHYEHLNLGSPTGVSPVDGRNLYWSDPVTGSGGGRANSDPRFNDVLLLSNTDEGERTAATISLEKTWQMDSGDRVFGKLAYTHTDASDVNPGTSSRAISNWNNRAIFNPNEEVASPSNTEISNRVIALLSYQANWFDFGTTGFSAFFEHRSGRPFSWTFDNDANGDFIRDNDLLYVPAGPGDVIFTGGSAMEAEFLSFVESVDTLRNAKGTVVGRNTDRSSSVNQIDIRITQSIDIGNFSNLELFLDIENFGNLIDDDWGVIEQVPFEYVAEVVDFEGIDPATGRYIYDYSGRTDFESRQDGAAQSRWAAQIGLRFDF